MTASEIAPRLLLADDLEPNRFLLEEALEGMRLEIFTAESGEQALQIAASRHPEVILLDRQMPGLDGIETARRIREIPDAPYSYIVILSGFDEAEGPEAVGSSTVDRFLTKPYRLDELREMVRKGVQAARERRRGE